MKHVNPKTAVFFWFLAVFAVVGFLFYKVEKIQEERQSEYLERLGSEPSAPICLQMYSYIEKYSKEYKVPRHVAYNVAYRETGYRGPFHWSYTTKHVSSMGAVGPMQIIPVYAPPFAGKVVSSEELMNSVELNVRVSMKMLRHWYSLSRDWNLSCGGYNSGKLIVNEYASYCANNKDYKKNWYKPKD
jgi:soluble lytic murein transglycosylase-like protein